jgi:hypothetical protein
MAKKGNAKLETQAATASEVGTPETSTATATATTNETGGAAPTEPAFDAART